MTLEQGCRRIEHSLTRSVRLEDSPGHRTSLIPGGARHCDDVAEPGGLGVVLGAREPEVGGRSVKPALPRSPRVTGCATVLAMIAGLKAGLKHR